MIKFFDYVFYRIFWWNTKVVKNIGIPFFSTVLGISLFQAFNLITLVLALLLYIIDYNDKIANASFDIIPTLVLFYNLWRYSENDYFKEVIKENGRLSKEVKRKNDYWVIFYIFITFSSSIYILTKGREYH